VKVHRNWGFGFIHGV